MLFRLCAYPSQLTSHRLSSCFNHHSPFVRLHLMGFRVFGFSSSVILHFYLQFLSSDTIRLPLCDNKTESVCTINLMFMLLLHPAASSGASIARRGTAGHVRHAAYARVAADTPSGAAVYFPAYATCHVHALGTLRHSPPKVCKYNKLIFSLLAMGRELCLALVR